LAPPLRSRPEMAAAPKPLKTIKQNLLVSPKPAYLAKTGARPLPALGLAPREGARIALPISGTPKFFRTASQIFVDRDRCPATQTRSRHRCSQTEAIHRILLILDHCQLKPLSTRPPPGGHFAPSSRRRFVLWPLSLLFADIRPVVSNFLRRGGVYYDVKIPGQYMGWRNTGTHHASRCKTII